MWNSNDKNKKEAKKSASLKILVFQKIVIESWGHAIMLEKPKEHNFSILSGFVSKFNKCIFIVRKAMRKRAGKLVSLSWTFGFIG